MRPLHVVVGGGPAGLALTLRLLEWSDVLLVEEGFCPEEIECHCRNSTFEDHAVASVAACDGSRLDCAGEEKKIRSCIAKNSCPVIDTRREVQRVLACTTVD